VHVTITSIEYFPEMGSYKVFLKMYHDDFLLDLEKNNMDSLINISSKNGTLHNSIVGKYLDKNLVLFEDQYKLKGEVVDIKITGGEILVNLNFKSEKNPGSLTVRNLIMTGLYSDQANMMIVKVNTMEEGVKLTPENTEQTFIIK
jgi:hypothetical protein